MHASIYKVTVGVKKKWLPSILLVGSILALSTDAFAIALKLGVGQQEALTFESIAKSVSVDRTGIVDVQKGETKSKRKNKKKRKTERLTKENMDGQGGH